MSDPFEVRLPEPLTGATYPDPEPQPHVWEVRADTTVCSLCGASAYDNPGDHCPAEIERQSDPDTEPETPLYSHEVSNDAGPQPGDEDMVFGEVPIGDLQPWPDNPRRITDHDVKKLADHMLAVDRFTDPILLAPDVDPYIVAGHRRRLAAKLLGLTHVPVIKHYGLTPEQVHAIRIGNNRMATDVQFDKASLTDQLMALEQLGMQPSLLGFNEKDIAFYFDLDRSDVPDPEAATDAVLLPGDEIAIGPLSITVTDAVPEAEKVVTRLLSLARLVDAEAEIDGERLKAVAKGRKSGMIEQL